ncbi:unnamed protein product [Brassica napus]|uniref:(rape) hypothetical protein n=1 Tax=Brassica napus TaxID=3708 RepID=A0A816K3T5_BRANA|nr:unnamed protein product [Brassica napus]
MVLSLFNYFCKRHFLGNSMSFFTLMKLIVSTRGRHFGYFLGSVWLVWF